MLHLLIFLVIEFYARKAGYRFTHKNNSPSNLLPSQCISPSSLGKGRKKVSAKLNAESWFLILGHFCDVLRHCDSSPPSIGQKSHWCLEVIPTKCIHSLWILLLKYLLNILTAVQFHFWHHIVNYNILSPSEQWNRFCQGQLCLPWCPGSGHIGLLDFTLFHPVTRPLRMWYPLQEDLSHYLTASCPSDFRRAFLEFLTGSNDPFICFSSILSPPPFDCMSHEAIEDVRFWFPLYLQGLQGPCT